MKLQTTKELEVIANKCDKSAEKFAHDLLTALVDNSLTDDFGNYGIALHENINPDAKLTDIIDVMHMVGLKEVTCKDFHEIMHLEIVDTFECEKCGEHAIYDHSFIRLDGKKFDVYVCTECGEFTYIEHTNNEKI